MLTKTLKYIAVTAVVFSMFAGMSCKKDEDEIPSEISIYYKDRTPDIEDDVTSTPVKFTAYTTWYITIDSLYSSWLSVNAYAGSPGSFTLTCSTTMNDSLQSRKGVIVIHGENQSAQITLTQRGYKIIEFKDEPFKQYCLDNFDIDHSGYVTSREAHLASEINCPEMNITDLTGIDFFKNIKKLDISGNGIYTLSLAKCTALTNIRCQDCIFLSGLELGNNMKKLEFLNCSNCNLSSIYTDSCTLLRELNLKANNLLSLNVTSNKNLTILDVSENYQMTSLFIAEGQNIPSLKKEETTRIVYPSEIVTVPDPEFQKYLLQQFDVNRDNRIDAGEAEAVDYIRCHGQIGNPRPIYSLEGLEYFPNITELDCSYCMIDKLELGYNPKLLTIACQNNDNLESISISALSPLNRIFCSDCRSLTTLDLNNNQHIVEIHAENCNLTDIDLQECMSLTHLYVAHNNLSSLSTSDCKKLTYVDCSFNRLEELSITDRDSLAFVFCNHNRIHTLDLDPDRLIDVDCGNNEISGELNLADWKYLHTFVCDSNSITSLTLPDSTIMTMLDASCNNLTEMDLSVQPKLQYFYGEHNSLSSVNTEGLDLLERLNLRSNSFTGEVSFSHNRGLKILWIDQNPDLETLYIPKGLDQFDYKADAHVNVIER